MLKIRENILTMSTLYIIATPIGNLSDLTFRALEILKSVDAIVCEDTRVTSGLLARYQIQKPLMSVRERSSVREIERVIQRLEAGETLAYVTDAGTPGLSDPGGLLVETVLAKLPDTTIVPIPGANAVATLASVAGVPLDRYTVMGFPPHKKGRKTYFEEVVQSEHPVFFYESVHRIGRALKEVVALLSVDEDRTCIIGRELTKMHEEILRGSLREMAEREIMKKGEFVVLISRWMPKNFQYPISNSQQNDK